MFKYLKSLGGLEAMEKINIDKAKVMYDFLDSSKMFKGTVDKEFRSLMNIPFVTESAELDAKVVAATKAAGYDNLKGHKSVGGLRASVYNAMPKEGRGGPGGVPQEIRGRELLIFRSPSFSLKKKRIKRKFYRKAPPC